MTRDLVADRIHAALGLPPPEQAQPPRRPVHPVVKLARLIDAAADDWLSGRTAHIAALDRALKTATAEHVIAAHELLHHADEAP